MTGGRTGRTVQQTKLDKYTKPKSLAADPLTEMTVGQTSPGQATSSDPSLADIMSAIKGIQETLESKMDFISTEVNLLRADFGKMKDRVKDNQEEVTSLQSENKELKKQVQELQNTSDKLVEKMDDIEGRARRNNIRITGVPERSEGPAADLFVEDLVLKGLKTRGLSRYFSVERAHRIPSGRPKPGAPPRTIIARIFNFRDRDDILQEARKSPPVKIENTTVNFFPDFTLRVQKQRRDFLAVKKRMRNQGIKYSMLYPARLRVAVHDKIIFFDTPEEAWDWMDGRESRKTNGSTRDQGKQQPKTGEKNPNPDGRKSPEHASPPARSPRSTRTTRDENPDWYDEVG